MFASNEFNGLPFFTIGASPQEWVQLMWDDGPAVSAAEMLYVRYVLSAAAIQLVNEMSRSVYFP